MPDFRRRLFPALCALCFLAGALRADTLIFTNGDQLSGKLVRADPATCIFQSDQAGTVTVPWSHVRSLTTSEPFVLVEKDGSTHRGQLQIAGSAIKFSGEAGTPAASFDLKDTRMILDPATYAQESTAHPMPWQGWRGIVSGGFSQISATQNSSSYTGSVNVQRPVPSLDWLPKGSDTLLHFQGTYGKLSQPGEPTVVTSIYTGGLEQDEDVTNRLFLFGNGQLDHNLAQGLELQQAYGGGVGWKLIDSAQSQLAVKADLHWTHQHFLATANQNFLASSFSESLRENYYGKVIWTESISLTPSITNTSAYQMAALSSWAVPLYKSLSLNFTFVDSYLNNPQPGFLKNSLQLSTGLQITVK